MFESSMMLTVTDYAMNTDKRHGMPSVSACARRGNSVYPLDHEPSMWDGLDAKFMKYNNQITAKL